jgi:hypothetical protein
MAEQSKQKLASYLCLAYGLLFTTIACAGCQPNEQPQNDPPVVIKGHICTMRGLAQSGLLKGIDRDDRYRPVSRARVFLALDENKRIIIENAVTHSDGNGDYELVVHKLPRPRDPNGWYYIFIEKDGFEPVIHTIGFGPLSGYMTNTAILKQTVE